MDRDAAGRNVPVVDLLDLSVALVKEWGNAQLTNGQTLREVLTIQGISLWDAAAVDLARIHVPTALRPGKRTGSFVKWTRQRLGWLKQRSRERMTNSPLCRCGNGSKLTFLVLGFAGYQYRDVLQPLAASLETSDDVSVVTLHDHFKRDTARSMSRGISQSIWEHWHRDVYERACSLRRDLDAAIREARLLALLPQLIQHNGRSLWPQMGEVVRWLLRVHLPRLLSQAAIADHLLEKYKPALIISADVADPRVRLYCMLGKCRKIPSLQIQYGNCGADTIEWQFFLGNALAVWGEGAREVMLSHGVPAGLITVTGSPRHDALMRMTSEKVAKTRDRLGVPAGKTVVLFASSYYLDAGDPNSNPAILEGVKDAIYDAVVTVNGPVLVVKPHPLETMSRDQRKRPGKKGRIIFVDRRDDIRDLIKACDVFITLGSASTVDALIAGKLVICPVFPNWPGTDLLFYARSGATRIVRSPEELRGILQMLARGSLADLREAVDEGRTRFLRRWVHHIDGRAAARVGTLARRVAQSALQ